MNAVAAGRERSVEGIKKYKKNRWKRVVSAGLVSASVAAGSIAVLEYQKAGEYLLEKEKLEAQLDSYRHMVYLAAEKIPKGTVLDETMVYQEIRYSDLSDREFITEEAFGKTLAVDVAEGICLRPDMLYSEQGNVREVFISEVELPEHLATGDRIDIRIRYENAEDYIVLVDKVLTRCESGNGMLLKLSEDEILFLASAVTDSGNYTGTKLYAAEYPEYAVIDRAQVNYIAKREILALLGREKTEGESRAALEERLLQNQ